MLHTIPPKVMTRAIDKICLNTTPLREIPWPQAYAELGAVHPRIACAVDDFYLSLTEDDRNTLRIAVAEYPYGDKIVDDGYPYFPGGTKIPEYFLASEYLPFGFILENCCEVSNYIFTADSLEQISDAILPVGGTIGLFEIADCLSNAPLRRKPDWHITAGATSIHVPLNFATQQNRNIIERRLGENVDFLNLRNASSAIEQLFALEKFNRIRCAWTVRVLFFSRSWFTLLKNMYLPAANSLRARLISRAWKSFVPLRKQKSNRLREYLNDAVKDGGNQRQLAEPAASLLASIEEILIGRRPFFVPKRNDCSMGPFGAISEELLKHFTQDCWILAPEYISEQYEVGYLRLDHASPTILNGPAKAIKDKVIEVMSILRAAAQAARRRRDGDHSSFDLRAYLDLLPHVMFQTPATRSKSVPAQGPSIYQIQMDDQLKRAAPLPMTQQQFYYPHFDVIPRERSAFFRNSLRLSMNSL